MPASIRRRAVRRKSSRHSSRPSWRSGRRSSRRPVRAWIDLEATMTNKLHWGIAAALAALLVACATSDSGPGAVSIGDSDLGGVVSSANGPEAGVWVIAETTGLPTKYAKMVVTDDKGRYVVPGLPKATYDVWVRGYGLVDSPKVRTEPGKQLNLTSVIAPDERAAAQYYPAIYWYSMLQIPPQSEFGGHTRIPKERSQVDWLKQM